MKRGLEICKLRTEPMPVDHLGLPPLYGLFMKLYNLRKVGFLNSVVYRYTETQRRTLIDIVYLHDDHIGYGEFFSVEEAAEATEGAFNDEQRAFLEGKYRVIGVDGSGHHLFYVGVDPATNQDQIFVDTELFDGIVEDLLRLTKIADNMFEFMNGFAFVEEPEPTIFPGVTYDMLYQNWGENFWRVRGQ